MMSYTVAIFMVNLACGGPEEGGWWYNYGTPADEFAQYTRGFESEEEAFAYQHVLDTTVTPELNEGRAELRSVLSCGRFSAVVTDGNPRPFPDQRPTYE